MPFSIPFHSLKTVARATGTAVIAATVAGIVVTACTESSQKTITAPESSPRNSTIQGGGLGNGSTVTVCVDGGAPAGTYKFKNAGFLSDFEIGVSDLTVDGADGGSGTSVENAADGVEYTIAVGACQTVETRTSPDATYPTFSDTWSGITVSPSTIPANAVYSHTDCFLDSGDKHAISDPCGAGNLHTRAYMNHDHGAVIDYYFDSAPVTSTGQIAPTATTCAEYAKGTSSTLTDILDGFKTNTINSAAPGVFFYFAKLHKTAGQPVGFIQSVAPNAAGLPPYVVQQTQAYLYTFNGSTCTTVATLSLSSDGTTGSGGSALATGNYVLGVKFTSDAAKGIVVAPSLTTSGSLLATHNYEATENGSPDATTTASVNTKAK